jgi:hypothetical protein
MLPQVFNGAIVQCLTTSLRLDMLEQTRQFVQPSSAVWAEVQLNSAIHRVNVLSLQHI